MFWKAKHIYSLSQRQAQLCFNSCRQDYGNYVKGVGALLHNAFCTVTEPLKADDSPTIVESPELPSWVKPSDKNKGPGKVEDDDFVPPSISYWIENHGTRVQEIDMKAVVNDIVESDVDKVSKILKNKFDSPDSVVEALNGCDFDVSDSSVEQVLGRFGYDWIQCFGFFRWAELQKGTKHSPDLYNLIVDNLGKTKKFDVMWELVEEMRELKEYITLETMTKILRRLAKAGKYEDAIKAFERMETFGVEKDVTALNRLTDALVKQGSIEHAERAYIEYRESIPPNAQTFNMLVHGWCKTRQMEKAKKTIDEMRENGFCPNSVTYTSLIEAYCREKDFRLADKILQQMKKKGFHPSVVTYTIMMHAFAKAKEIKKAMEVYEEMKKNNCLPDAPFYNAFINALSRAGMLKDADEAFDDMSKQGVTPDASTYNTLIYIAAKDLQEEKALNLLKKMDEMKCKADLNTYAPLLKMCCKLKRMKVLSFLLSHMFKNDVGLDLGTYSLLVNRLCKNGKVERACSFFEESVAKGFVPMDSTFESLVKVLDKKGMGEEKRRLEELMSKAKEGSGLSQPL